VRKVSAATAAALEMNKARMKKLTREQRVASATIAARAAAIARTAKAQARKAALAAEEPEAVSA